MATTTGATGKTYTTNSDGSLTVNRPDGTSSTVRQGDANYSATISAMNADVPKGTSTGSTSYGSSSGGTNINTYVNNLANQAGIGTSGTISGATNAAGKSFDLNIGNGSLDWSTAGVGSTGKSYATSNGNQSIAVTYKDGTTRLVNPGDADYNTTYQAMQTDLKSNGINYVPTYTTTVYRDVVGNDQDGYQIDYSKPSTFKNVAYTVGNPELQKAIRDSGSSDVNDYVKSLYNNPDMSQNDIDNMLNAYGLSDFNSQNAIYTAGKNILPGGNAANLGRWSYGDEGIMVNGSPQSGLYYTYGGQTYLMGGDAANLAQYANGKTGNWTRADYTLGNIGNNPMVQGDQDLYSAYQNQNNAYNALNTVGTGNNVANGTTINNNTLNAAYNGGNGSAGTNLALTLNSGGQVTPEGSNLLNTVISMLTQGLNSQQQYLSSKEDDARANADELRHQAWINSQINGVQTRNRLAGQGLATSGAMDSAMMGVQNNYNTALNDVNTNLKDTLNNLNEAGLKALTDYANQVTEYTYNITEADMQRALQQMQINLQQQEFEWNRQYQQQQLAQEQAKLDYDKKIDTYNRYQDMYNEGILSPQGLVNVGNALGLTDNGWFANGLYNGGTSATDLAYQNALLENSYLNSQIANKDANTALTNRKPK